MSKRSIAVVRGSGNVYRDFGYADADIRQAKAMMAAEIIKILDEENLSTRQAEASTGISHSEFARIRRVNLARFTIDRLIAILNRLGREVSISAAVHRKRGVRTATRAAHP